METLLDWIATQPTWAGLAVFLVAFSESLAVVGLIMPGAFLMFGIGSLIALGYLEFLPTMAWAVTGAILGDGLSFWLGHHFHQELRTIWPFRNHPRLVNRGVDFFHRHGGKSILFGRFVGPVRPILPAVAGMLGMPVGRYLTINVLSGLVWAPAYLLPGMLFGASLELAAAVTGRLALLLLLLAGLFWLTFSLVRILWRLGVPHARMTVLRLLDWGRHHPRFATLTAAIGDPGGAEARGLLVLAVALLGSASLLFGLGLLLFSYPSAFDRTLHGLLLGLRSPPADLALIAATELGDGLFLGLYAVLVALGLAWHDRRAALHWLAAVAFAMIAPALLKGLFQISRPEPFDILMSSFSFPSAHALRATVVYGFAAVLLARVTPPPWRWAPYGLAALLVTTIAFSRPYLGVHWSGDVVAGSLLGLLWVGLLGTAFRVRATDTTSFLHQAVVVLLPLALVAALYLPLRLADDVARYDPAVTPVSLSTERWLDDPWSALARRTPETIGIAGEPRIAWVAPLSRVREDLQQAGWTSFADEGPERWLRLLSPQAILADLPPLPQVHDGRGETLVRVLVEPGESRLVLRFWDSGHRVETIPVWIGRMVRERPERLLGMLTYARGTPATPADLTALEASLGTSGPRLSSGARLRVGPPGP